MKSIFQNNERLASLYRAALDADQPKMELIVQDPAHNKILKSKIDRSTWKELKEDVVYKLSTDSEDAVIKTFDSFPFAEIYGNIMATHLLEQVPFFVRTFDIGMWDNKFVIIMEFLNHDTEFIDLDEPRNMYNFFYQTAYALTEMEKCCKCVHFDLRYDNIMIKKTKIGRDLFNNGIMTEFIIKIGDFGQCEFDFGETRSMNPDIPREPKYFKKWGIYPNEFSGYDFQYLLATLTPILNNKYGLSYYYIHTMLLDFIQPVKFTTAQDRPLQITDKTPRDILIFLKQVVLKTLH